MSLETLLILATIVAAALGLRRLALIPAKAACRYLDQGAWIVDVRTPEEFARSHVPGAINLPLAGWPESLIARIPDKSQTVLLHCLGGGRSAIAEARLRTRGYSRAFNLGSLKRAERIVAQAFASKPAGRC